MEEEERGSGSGRTVFFVSCSAGSSSAQVGRELAPRTAQPAAAPGGILRPPPPSGTGRDRVGRGDGAGPGPAGDVDLSGWIGCWSRCRSPRGTASRSGLGCRAGCRSRWRCWSGAGPLRGVKRGVGERGLRLGWGWRGGGASCIPGGSVGPGGRGGAGTLHLGASLQGARART